MKKLVFICTGNTCRSNVAEVLAVQAAAMQGLFGWEFSSAGLMAFPGTPASEHSSQVMREMGLDLSSHQARAVDKRLVAEADLILTMTPSHKQQLVYCYPHAESKVFTLLEYAYGYSDAVDDPFGGDINIYRRTSGQIKDAVAKVIERLNKEKV